MRFIAMAALAALAAASAAPARAQLGNPGGMTPGVRQSEPGIPAPGQPNTADRLFARLATAGGLAEVDLGMLAGERAGREAVKEFAARMVDDHSKANVRLAAVAKAAGIPLPDEPDAAHKAIRNRLEKTEGGAFDAAYMSAQVEDHIKTAQLLAWEINSGQDADIVHFAAETLPAVLGHLREAQELLLRLRAEAVASR